MFEKRRLSKLENKMDAIAPEQDQEEILRILEAQIAQAGEYDETQRRRQKMCDDHVRGPHISRSDIRTGLWKPGREGVPIFPEYLEADLAAAAASKAPAPGRIRLSLAMMEEIAGPAFGSAR